VAVTEADGMAEDPDLARSPEFFHLLVSSYERFIGAPLAPAGGGAHWLYHHAPFAVVAHNTDPDPRFVYANKTAQACFEYSWEEFTSLRSRFSAEAPDRAERQRLLDAVARDGFVTSYQGVRIARSGRRFWIKDGVVWQLIDENGRWHGQAATFPSWQAV
jgi:hypothetical protein